MKAKELIKGNSYLFITGNESQTVTYSECISKNAQIVFTFVTRSGGKIFLTEKNIETEIQKKEN